MKKNVLHIFYILVSSLFFTACEVGITPLEHAANEINVVTTGTEDIDGNVDSISIEIPEGSIDLDVSVELYGSGSEYFTIKLDKTSRAYQGKVVLRDNPPLFYQDKTFHFFARTVVNGQKMCQGDVSKTIYKTEVAPVASSRSVTVDEDSRVTFALSVIDLNEDVLSYTIREQPRHGTLSGNGTTFTYIPNPNYFGNDSFSYVVNDGRSDSNVARVDIWSLNQHGTHP